nr:putative ribonuclease h protein [Quercus suber]
MRDEMGWDGLFLVDKDSYGKTKMVGLGVGRVKSPTSAQAILSTPIPSRPKPDKFLWIPDSKGLFLVKSAYKELLPNPPPQASSNVNWSKLWKIRGLERIKIFLWRVTVNVLPTRENLMGHMDILDSTCVLCNMEVESAPRLFLRCPIARAIWFATCWRFKSDQLGYTNDIIKCILDPPFRPMPSSGPLTRIIQHGVHPRRDMAYSKCCAPS